MAAPTVYRSLTRFPVLHKSILAECPKTFINVQPCRFKQSIVFKKKEERKAAGSGPQAPIEKKFLRDTPLHSVYIVDDYPPQPFTLEECFTMHKEAAQPAMTNTLHAQVYADILLDMSTLKKTKFMKNVRGLLDFPHKFIHGQKKTYMIFSEDQKDVELAKAKGAQYAGGDDIFNYIKQNLIRREDIEQCDFVLSTPTMAVKLMGIKPILQEMLPSVKNGCVFNNLAETLALYEQNVRFKSIRESDAVGHMQVPFGQLNQDLPQIKDNFKYLTKCLNDLKPSGGFMKELYVIAPPSAERFMLTKTEHAAEKAKSKKQQSKQETEDDDEDEEE
ncbi:50S ribosomal protein L1-like isoform X2 [Dreissena polymorpha]|uniref:Mitochondrial ribosomal protein L1 n=1 Tax=Dreissena polymorpha TaxID=45954 RepID=A0A9D4RAN5_DREPO|nr:50S ribosomal protein L1-like isoform X1 [Dreissena polymorpha]XP_052262053.1 50S ribosomal protein L1-like isoform X2 [Dreissena polymorpha]KAH3861376.1 hypothetical protein DPMN_024304 [Dreissena polymorpha]